MLGFPIRTPPDHSSVANSPGLIAGSYVLHRLLMPRHPPCALHSLSQQRHNNTNNMPCDTNRAQTQRTTTSHTHNHRRNRHRHDQQENQPCRTTNSFTNCSRQHTQPRPQPRLRMSPDARVHYADLKQQPHQHPHPATADLGRRRTRSPAITADTSGPNSVPDPAPTNAGPR